MKITKAQAGYTFHPDVPAYVCEDCIFEKDLKGKDYCSLFGAAITINEKTGSCNMWSHGEPEKQKIDVPLLSIFTKSQLGYDENRFGFSCKRCSHFGIGKNDCEVVDKNSTGDTPGQISPNACCSVWTRDSKRGGMTDQQLVQILSAAAKPQPPKPSLKQIAGGK